MLLLCSQVRVDPYDAAGQPLPLLAPAAEGDVGVGKGDSRVQAYNFRLCATNDPAGTAHFPLPDPTSVFAGNNLTFELARRVFADPKWQSRIGRPGCPGTEFPCFTKESPPLDPNSPGGGHKRDWNNPFLGPVNTDCVTGCNQSAYPTASVAERLQIWEAHRQYYLALRHFFLTDSAIPAEVRARVAAWGLCRDEFGATGHWSPQLYTRETRRGGLLATAFSLKTRRRQRLAGGTSPSASATTHSTATLPSALHARRGMTFAAPARVPPGWWSGKWRRAALPGQRGMCSPAWPTLMRSRYGRCCLGERK